MNAMVTCEMLHYLLMPYCAWFTLLIVP